MKFLHPGFLFALFAIAIPIIIHLFNFRKFKTVYFTNVRFLREVKQESQSRNKLRHLLILLARCLAIIALVMAFAQPYIPANKKVAIGEKAVSVFLDNSFSMDALAEAGSLFDQAKKAAREIAMAYKPTDRFQLITSDMEGRHMRWVNREQFISLVDEVSISPNAPLLSEVQKKQLDMLSKAESNLKQIYIISDLQKSQADVNALRADSLIEYKFVRIPSQSVNNVFIDSCWFDRPFRSINEPDALNFIVRNYATRSIENLPVSLEINGISKGIQNISAGADSAVTASISFLTSAPGSYAGSIKLNDHPISYDNELFLAFNVRERINVLVIAELEKQKYFRKLYGSNPGFAFETMLPGQVDYSAFKNQQLIILNAVSELSSGFQQELSKFVNEGGHVLFFPDLKGNINSYNTLLSNLGAGNYAPAPAAADKVEKINIQHRIYDDVFEKIPENIDLPIVNQHLQLNLLSRSRTEAVLTLQSGFPFIIQFNSGEGKFYAVAAPLDEQITNFPRHAIFIPTLYKIALYSVSQSKLYYTIGRNEPIPVPEYRKTSEQALKLSSADGKFEIIPEYRFVEGKAFIYVFNQIKQSGIYELKAGNEIITLLAFNYDRKESDLSSWNDKELEEQLVESGFTLYNILETSRVELTEVVKQLDEGKKLWKIFIILALLFVLFEILLIRFLK
jgi:hypothetical protein